jgi:hypothetical protein
MGPARKGGREASLYRRMEYPTLMVEPKRRRGPSNACVALFTQGSPPHFPPETRMRYPSACRLDRRLWVRAQQETPTGGIA